MTRDYPDVFDALLHVYLEDSWVLRVVPSESMVAFHLDIVLTPEHPAYAGARPGEQYDYRSAELLVTGQQVFVELSDAPPAISADGSRDLGNIDSWRTDADGWSTLQGEWGTARVLTPEVRLTLDDRV